MVAPLTIEEYWEQEVARITSDRREPNITFRDLVVMFGEDEEARKLAKKQIRSLTIQRNRVLRPSLLIDKDLRWVVDETNKLEAEGIDKQIRFYKNFLATATADKDTSDGSLTDAQIQIAKEYPIKELLESFGYYFQRDFTKCMFHEEATASLHYIKGRNTVYCHGCQKHADTIEIVRHFKGVGFVQAVKELNQ